MELHDLAEYRLSRTRRTAGLAIPENGGPCDAAHDEQAGCNGTIPLASVWFSFAHRHEATTRVANVRLCRRFQGHARRVRRRAAEPFSPPARCHTEIPQLED